MNLIDVAINGYKPMPTELDSFTGVRKNGKASLQVTPGATFSMIELISNITDAALITKVEAVLNGESIVDVTGADIQKVMKYVKREREAGRYVINWFHPEAKTINGQRLGELVTLPTDSLTIYVTFGDTGEVTPTLRARALVTGSQSVRYFIPKIYSLNVDPASSGENRFTWQHRSAALFIRRLHWESDKLTKLVVKRDDLTVYEALKADNDADLAEGGDNAPQPGTFHFDPAHIGFQLEGLFPTVARKELSFRYTMSEVAPVRLLVETIEQVTPSPVAR